MNFLTASVEIKVEDRGLVSQLAKAKSAVTRTVSKITTSFNRMATSFKAAFRKMTRYAKIGALAIAGALTLSIKAFASFQEQLANVSTMLDEQTMRYIPGYAKALKKIAMEFGEGTNTLSKGLYDILSASIPANKAIKVLTVSVKAAKAGMTTTAVAADAITTILNSYGLAAEDAGRVSDILFAIVKRGKLTFEELASSIGTVAAIANIAGLSFEEVGAAIATMTRAGLRADLAITSLRAIINTFLKPTDEAIEMTKQFGFELGSASLKTMGLTGVLEKLKGATAEQLTTLMPNIRGLAGFAAALKQSEGMASDLDLMLNSLGLTQQAYDKMTNTLTHTFDKLWQSIKITSVQLGDYLAPAIDETVKGMNEWISINQQEIGLVFIEAVRGMVLSIQRLVKQTLLLTAYWKEFQIVVINVALAFWKVADASTNLDEAFAWLRGDTETYKNIIKGLEKDIGELEGEVRDLALAFVEGEPKIDAFFDNLIKNLEKAKAKLKPDFIITFPDIIKFEREPFSWEKPEDKPFDKDIKEVDKVLKESIGNYAQDWVNANALIKDSITGTYSVIKRVVSNTLDSIGDALTDMVMKGKADFKSLANSILRDITQMMIKAQMARAIGIIFPSLIPVAPVIPQPVYQVPSPAGKPDFQHGGTVEKTGWAKVHKGETFSGVGGGGGKPMRFDFHIHNEGDEQMDISNVQTEPDTEGYVINIMIKDSLSNGRFSQLQESRFRKS